MSIKSHFCISLFASICLVLAAQCPANAEQMRFRQISLEQGLSQSSVYAIWQDKQGFLWFGTQDGLNRYDGYTLTVFREQTNNANSLPNNCIQTLHEDRLGTLWIGTRGGGAAKRNPYSGVFSPAFTMSQEARKTSFGGSLGIEEQDVYAFSSDSAGKMWIGTGAGLLKVNPKTNTLEEQISTRNSPLKSPMIRALLCDKAGILWIATPEGLYSYNPVSKQWQTFRHDDSNPASLPDNDLRTMITPITASGSNTDEIIVGTASALVRFSASEGKVVATLPHATRAKSNINALCAVRNGTFWAGYGGDGLHECAAVFAERQGLTERRAFRHAINQPNSLSNDVILSLYFDRAGGLWTGTDGGGVSYAHPDEYRFENFTNDAVGAGGNIVLSLTEGMNNSATQGGTTQGNIWLGTLSEGIARFHPTLHTFQTFRNSPANTRSLANNVVWAVLTDSKGVLWVGTNAGLSRFNAASGDFTNYFHDPNNPKSLPDNSIYALLEDSHGNLWVATNGGLARMNRENATFTTFRSNGTANALSSNAVRKIYEDRSGILWIGTRGGGLNRFDVQSTSFLHFRHMSSNPTSISSDYVLSIHEDRTGTLWIGTAGGLNKFDRTNGVFTAFREGEGVGASEVVNKLPNNYICGILEDDSGNLWLGTVRGICKFDPRTGKFATFEELYNRSGSEFNQDACLRARNGMFYFGGINGFVRFHPDSIHTNFSVPPVVLTGFKKFNKPVDMPLLGDSLLPTKHELHLSVDDTFISFEFAALSFTLPHKISYSCKLEGFDEDWIDLGNKREATYTNLDAGEYVFCVRATNYDGVWNKEGTSLKVIIHPHWWQTWWAKSMATAALLLLAFVAYKWRIRRIEARSTDLEQTVGERTAALSMSNREITRQNDSLTALNQEKNEFLGIAAHDLKNPLTAIMMSSSIVKQYHSKMTADEVIEQMDHILITAKRMKETILNLLDINSIESGRFKFTNIPMNVVEVVNDVVEGYYLRAKDKEISLHLNTETDEIMTFTDRNAFMQVMENLISNAIKYSPLGKNVYVNIISSDTDQMQALFVREEARLEQIPSSGAHVRIEIQDEGPGLDADDKQKLFGKFAKLSAKPTGGEHSTGLGLSIVKKIVEAMHGRVWCESELGHGATFIVELPLVEIPPEAAMQD